MERSWATHGVGDSFPPTQNLNGHPWEWAVGHVPHVTSFADELCFNSSGVVVINSSLNFDGEGERTGLSLWGDAARFGVAGIPPSDLSSLSSFLPESSA